MRGQETQNIIVMQNSNIIPRVEINVMFKKRLKVMILKTYVRIARQSEIQSALLVE